ncbi:12-oxophytodienoate reductase, putative [Paecilomyces variotii No. 5]|uniref:12-oxophytodienoate reductase, putative n=1 Tax=Byssochlamys spectabilis (strain No. 5 / NBRC 109023) TaxID=1356009 RepID=V5I5I4_BYSSN|nr:12-oxophytodienoate reductase, putative [Paecilomyces variotii No. 5]
MAGMEGAQSKLFTPLTIANGKIKLQHRVVLAPLTRNRGTPLNATSTPDNPNRIWTPNELMAKQYAQRTTEGGLLISEGIPPSLESNGMPGVPGIFAPEQVEGWKKVVEAVHAKGGFIYAQLWHAGRATISAMTGSSPVSASATPWDSPDELYSHPLPGSTERQRYVDSPPIELSIPHIKRTIQDFCNAAKSAMQVGFDGVELHGGNGYLLEQFLSSNVNKRTDEYGGSPERRCKFVLDLMDALAETIGEENMSIRLSPFGLFNQARGEQRMETWTHLCERLKESHPNLSYVSFIEPRFEQIYSVEEKDSFLRSWGLENIDLQPFRKIMGSTPFFSAGGFDDTNSWGVLESGKYDALLYGRYFISNPDLPERLKNGYTLRPYDRSTFYGPFDEPEVGYVDYPTMEEEISKV